MTKETLIILVEKEIAEIASLTKGFAELDTFPKPLMDMALAKSENLTECLKQLAAWKKETPVEPTVTVAEPIVETPVAEVVAQPEIEEEKPAEKPSEPKTILAETIKQTASVLETLAKDDTRIGSSLGHQKITELKSTISIADRFRFQRELFLGNGEKMSQAISDFDAMKSLEEANAYIAKKFKWNESDPNVVDFMDLLQRRYL